MPLKKLKWTASAVCLVLALTACGTKPSSPPAATSQPTAKPQASVPAQKEAVVKVYFGDQDASKLVEKSTTIRYAAEEEKYAAAYAELKKAPGADAVSLFSHTEFRSARLKNGTLTVDLSLAAENRMGSSGEILYLDALKKTAFQFKEVEALELLVDGKKADSLMGHMELPAIIKRK